MRRVRMQRCGVRMRRVQTFCLFEEELEPKSAVDRIDKDQRPSRNPVQFEECIHDQELVRVRAAQPELAELPLRGALSFFEVDRHCAKTNGDQGVRDMDGKNTMRVSHVDKVGVCGLRAACVRLACGLRATWVCASPGLWRNSEVTLLSSGVMVAERRSV